MLKFIVKYTIISACIAQPVWAKGSRNFLNIAKQSSLAKNLLPFKSSPNEKEWQKLAKLIDLGEQAMWGRTYGSSRWVNPQILTRKKAYYMSFLGGLTSHWHLEAIGAPEARQLVNDLQQADFHFYPSPVVIFDEDGDFSHSLFNKGKNTKIKKSLRVTDNVQVDRMRRRRKKQQKQEETDHAMMVAHLIAGTEPFLGTSANAEIARIIDTSGVQDKQALLKKFVDTPGIINVSMSLPTQQPRKMKNFLSDIGEKTLIIQSAGNDFAKKELDTIGKQLNIVQKYLDVPSMFLVGSTDPDGFVSDFSNSNNYVVVTAPSSNMRYRTYNGYSKGFFGGTSGAAPLVSGVLADVRSILPELTRTVAVALLQSTAIKTATNEVSDLNGAGVVNHYKMLRVALRLAADGYNGEEIPDNFHNYLDFSDEVDALLTENKITENKRIARNNLRLFLNLRRIFFLDPDNYTVRKLLASFYKKLDLDKQALHYDIPAQVVKDETVSKKIVERAIMGNYRIVRPNPHEDSFIIDETVSKLTEQKDISPQEALKHILVASENTDHTTKIENVLEVMSLVIEETDEYAKVLKAILATETSDQPYTAQEINDILRKQGIDKPLGNHLDAFAIPDHSTRRNEAIKNEVLQIISEEDPEKPYTYQQISKLLNSRDIHMHYQLAGSYATRIAGDSRQRKAIYQEYKLKVDDYFGSLISDPPENLGHDLFESVLFDGFQDEKKFLQKFILRSIVQSLLAKKAEILAAGMSLSHKKLADYLQHLQALDTAQAREELRKAYHRYTSLKKMLENIVKEDFINYTYFMKDPEDFIREKTRQYLDLYSNFIYYGVFERDNFLNIPTVHEIANILTYIAGKMKTEQDKHTELYTFATQLLLHNLFYEEGGDLFFSSIKEEEALAKAINLLLTAGFGVFRNSSAHDLLTLAYVIENEKRSEWDKKFGKNEQ